MASLSAQKVVPSRTNSLIAVMERVNSIERSWE